jgi:hypothetical protein
MPTPRLTAEERRRRQLEASERVRLERLRLTAVARAAEPPVMRQLADEVIFRTPEQGAVMRRYYQDHAERLRSMRALGVIDPGRLHPRW